MTPARARRRVTRSVVFLPGAANRGNAIGIYLEKAKNNVSSRNIFQAKTSHYTARAGSEEINNLRRMQTMQMTRSKKSLSLIVCIVLIAAMALITTGCTDNKKETQNPAPKDDAVQTEVTVLGEGETTFAFTVTDAEGKETVFEIHTDKTIVGEALQELELISGEKGPYGLYVKTVNGEAHDYDKDGKYWAFYENGTLAPKGVDMTEITEGVSYAFKAE